MVHLPCRSAMILLSAAFFLLLRMVSPADASTPPTATATKGEKPGSSTIDGFHRTVAVFRSFEQKGEELASQLVKLHGAVVKDHPDDPAKQRTQFLRKLTELYPGSTYDGKTGTVAFQKNFVATFNDEMKVKSVSEQGTITVTYDFERGTIQLVGRSSSVTVVMDRSDPERSRFTKGVIPAIVDDAERALATPGYKRTSPQSVETSVLNDVYQLLNLTNALRMDDFAADIVQYPALQLKALKIAGKGYYNRHPDEYRRGEATIVQRVKLPSPGSASPLDMVRTLLLVVVCTVVAYVAAVGTNRMVRSLFRGKSDKMRMEKFGTLSPMVTSLLIRQGTSLWGKNRLWSKKFYITKRSDRWILSEGKPDGKESITTGGNRLEVCMRSAGFKVKITRLNGVAVNRAVTCKNFSVSELAEKVGEISSVFDEERAG